MTEFWEKRGLRNGNRYRTVRYGALTEKYFYWSNDIDTAMGTVPVQ